MNDNSSGRSAISLLAVSVRKLLEVDRVDTLLG